MRLLLFSLLVTSILACSSTKDTSMNNDNNIDDGPTFVDLPVDLSAFPEAKPGHKRHVLQLEPETNEKDLAIQLFIGEEMEVDCNQYWLGGTLHEKTVEGWGFSYYEFEAGEIAGTLMGCPEDQPKTRKFIHYRGETQPYNSAVAVVVYAPEQYELRYSVWEKRQGLIPVVSTN